jgi:hypothetical protein
MVGFLQRPKIVREKFLQKSNFVRTRLDGIGKKLVQLREVKSGNDFEARVCERFL